MANAALLPGLPYGFNVYVDGKYAALLDVDDLQSKTEISELLECAI